MTILSGQQAYDGSTKNGVTSWWFGPDSPAYRIEGVDGSNQPVPAPAVAVSEQLDAKPEQILAQPPLVNSVGIELKLIPAGTFEMGSNDGEADEKPVHEVRITKPFYLGVTEVTNAQWKAVMGDVPSKWKDDDRPVERVTWDDAVTFCEKLSARPEEKMTGRVYRLPSEAEWEYACRAGTTTRFSCGDDDASLTDFAWCQANAKGETHRVSGKRPNAWGLYDMHGNVREWCSDWYGTYPENVATNPQGPLSGTGRLCRGGGWSFHAKDCRSANRRTDDPSFRGLALGFRLALTPPESSLPAGSN